MKQEASMRSLARADRVSARFPFPAITPGLVLASMQRFFRPRERFRILAMEKMAPRVVRIRLAPESGPIHPYRAGQFLYIRFDIPGLPRKDQYVAICNPPGSSYLEIMIKGTNDWSLALHDRAENFPESGQPWLAWIDYPYGGFTCKGAGTGSWVFLAAGIGIAPFLAMAGDRHRDDARILILWSAYNRDELAGFDQLSSINARRSSIRMVPVLDHDPMWTGRRGQLDRQALEDLAGRELADPETRYWISCPASLRRNLVRVLKSLGVPRKRIRYEDCAV